MEKVIEILKLHGELSEIRTSVILAPTCLKPFYEKLGIKENREILSKHEYGIAQEIVLILDIN